jgi:hypothetical protein
MADMNYYNTLIAVADDCPVTSSVVPTARGARKTVAVVQYDMLAGSPHLLTQEDVLFESWLSRQDIAGNQSESARALMRKNFFAKPQPCLRASPLPKMFGWGLLFDHEGKVALCAIESQKYQRLIEREDSGVQILKALRSSRR